MEKTINLTNFSKYKTISNCNNNNEDNQNLYTNEKGNFEGKCFSNKELNTLTNDNLNYKNKIKGIIKENINNENQKNMNNEEASNKNIKTNNKFEFKKLPVKEKKK